METIIRFEEYTKILKKTEILKDISLEMKSGKLYKLKGTNGSGKTMLLRAIAGLIYPTTGAIYVNDVEIKKNCTYPASLGVLIENPSFWREYTGLEVLRYLASIKNNITDEDIKASMEKMGLSPDDKRKIGKYSLGMKQKLGIIQAIMEKPDILLLDEPLNALDSETIRLFQKVITEERERGAVVVIALHNDGEFEMDYDEVIKIENGKVVEHEK